jgi:hypothetical protein
MSIPKNSIGVERNTYFTRDSETGEDVKHTSWSVWSMGNFICECDDYEKAKRISSQIRKIQSQSTN